MPVYEKLDAGLAAGEISFLSKAADTRHSHCTIASCWKRINSVFARYWLTPVKNWRVASKKSNCQAVD